MKQIGHAIDVSRWQARIPEGTDDPHRSWWTTACIVRGAYGDQADVRVERHFDQARRMRFDHVGLYFFWRYYLPLEPQLSRWVRVAREVGLGSRGADLVPIIDVESEAGHPRLTPSDHVDLSFAIADIGRDFGVRPMVYISESGFAELGAPKRLLHYPLWWADYTGEAHYPEGADVRMRQHRVAPWEGPVSPPGLEPGPGAIDQSQIFAPMPTFGGSA